ncbi:LysR family transcriptional regulator [Pseudoroseicyclus tamaricis]|uniref:LysR family transcriptional regulator n=1 Tax=Pseudoroseicyclus tamaricis TaxID=2705421 RepID=A0A6B2JLI7_9RHOB|nr:LysR family transcriptional regulator [Pseudoroseicyclus tamaricis]NDV02423.1 LysR family transcriptional regulator [Pseudoroseicyclus tamaricis]
MAKVLSLDPRALMLFSRVVEERSFTRAAEALGMAQPALSKAVAQLEGRVGQSLLSRRRQPLEPTELGRELALRGTQLRAIIREAGQAAGQMADGQVGTIRIGAPPFFCEDVMARIVAEYHLENPGVRFELCSAYGPELRGRVTERRLDIALVPMESADNATGLVQRRIADAEHAVFVRAGFRADPALSLVETLEAGLWIGHAENSIMHGYAERVLAQLGVMHMRSFASSESGKALLNMLKLVESFAILPVITALNELRAGEVRVIGAPEDLPVVSLGTITHHASAGSPLLANFEAFAAARFRAMEAEVAQHLAEQR